MCRPCMLANKQTRKHPTDFRGIANGPEFNIQAANDLLVVRALRGNNYLA